MNKQELESKLKGRRVIVSMSGGKDSVATWLYLLRIGLTVEAVYTDTKWEWEGHSAHLDLLESRIGKIHRVDPSAPFESVVRSKKTFPSRVRRWCTQELKLEPMLRWLNQYRDREGCDVVLAVGVRRSESKARLELDEWEWAPFYDCEIWRPILDWEIPDVAAEHHRAAIPLHPLYHLGAERVGCFPCVNASKAELANVARIQPSRIDEIRELEREIGQTMFTRDRRTEKRREGGAGPSVVPIGIDDVIEWAKTGRGGAIQLERQPTGCARWGVCERPTDELIKK